MTEFFLAHPPDVLNTDRMWLNEINSVAEWCRPDSHGVDIGSGGRTLYPNVTRVDSNPACEPHHVADAGALPFGDGDFDWLFSGHTLEHCQHPRSVLREWLRVVKVGGFVALVLPDPRFTLTQNTDPTPHRYEWTAREFAVDVLGWQPDHAEPAIACRLVLDWAPARVLWLDEACPCWSFVCVLERLPSIPVTKPEWHREGMRGA